jgi:hypothetical protein
MVWQPVSPVIVRIVGAPTEELGVLDVILNAVGLTGLIVFASLLLGVALGALFIWFRNRWPSNTMNGENASDYALHLSAPSDPRHS